MNQSGGFGQQNQQSPFGSPSTSNTGSVFGASTGSSVFSSSFPSGGAGSGFPAATGGFGGGTPVFGSGSISSGTSVFGTAGSVAQGFGSSSTGTSGFGASNTGTLGFGSSNAGTQGFGSGSTRTAGFGASSTGTSGFGTSITGTSGFESSNMGVTGTGFGSGVVGFGASSTGPSGFGSSGTGSSTFGASSTGTFGFGSSTTGTSGFGSSSTGTSGFGSSSTRTSGFGSVNTGTSGFGSSSTGTSGFGSSSTGTSGFGSVNTGTSGFGSSSTGTSGFGSSSTGTSGFGSSSTGTSGFGSSSTGTSGFGSVNTGTSGFGSNTTGTSGFGSGSTGTSGFGSSSRGTTGFGSSGTGMPGFGSGGTGTSVFGSGSSSKGFGTVSSVFGSSGFGATASSASGSHVSSGFSQQGLGTGVTSSTAFGSNTPLFGTNKTSGFGGTGAGVPGFGTSTSNNTGFGTGATPTSSFGAGSSVFGTSTATSTVFGTATNQGTSSVFGSSSGTGFGVGGNTGAGFGGGKGTLTETGTRALGQAGLSSGGVKQTGFGTGGTQQAGLGTGQTGFGHGGASRTSGGFGSPTFATATSSTSGITTATSQGSSGFGASIAFGTKTSPSSVTGSSTVFSPTASSVRSSLITTSSFSTSSVFGGAQNTSSSSPNPFGQTSSSFGVFGGVSNTAKNTTAAGSGGGSKGMLFPSAAATGGKSVFGGTTTASSSSAGQGVSTASGTAGEFCTIKNASSSQSSEASLQRSKPSVFGGQPTSKFRWTRASESSVKPESGATVFGGGKESGIRHLPLEGAGQGQGSSGGQATGMKTDRDTKSTSQSSVFGVHSITSGSTVFGGRKEPAATFNFSATSGATGQGSAGSGSVSQKRGAESDTDRGSTDSKRGRGGEDDRDGHTQYGTPPGQIRRRSSSLLEDVSSKTAITCKRVPANLNKGSILRKHFSKFGKVKRVSAVPTKMTATIYFEDHEAAAAAKKHGSRLSAMDPPMTIFFKSSKSDKSPSTPTDASQLHPWSKPRGLQTREESLRRSKTQHTLSLPSSVADELASMGGAEELTSYSDYHVLDRPGKRDRSAQESRSLRRVSPTRQTSPPPQASTSSASPKKTAAIDAATISNLRKMMCTTTTEKISVLDTRDKLLRQMRDKQHGSALQRKAFVGTCPDMCPEKERYYREEVRRLSIYEIIPGSSTQTGSTSLVDHSRAVKEYSRSSADQDEPLPHELRPQPVLTMTMNYLLSEIAGSGEDGKWAEWYDFLWNRTRGIRKDITQQQLCSREVVELIEKCTRFHIYCSERLCMEDMMVFDSKINNENLTKCLQTLKELYADLEKHGVLCPNEAEFRAYMVLMNLNEGDTLREVQQLRPDVRGSREINFAVKAYSALNSNNYVRFFRLVGTASFLNACVLHRYFNQMRARALQVLLRAHTKGPRQKTMFPLSELVRLLAFENEAHVREFCAYYGLVAEGSDLVLDRSMYVEPESSIPAWRAQALVESKQMVSVGETINGERLQPVQLPPPQCSFDDQGHFIARLEGLTDSAEKSAGRAVVGVVAPPTQAQQAAAETPVMLAKAVTNSGSQSQSQSGPAAAQAASFSSEAVKMIARDLFWEVIDEMARDVSQSLCSAIQFYLSFDKVFMEDLVTEVSSQMIREASSQVLDSERNLRQLQKEAERREQRDRLTEETSSVILNEAVDEEVTKIIECELREAHARDHAERQERCVNTMCSELLLEISTEMTEEIAEEVHAVDVVARLQMLSELQRAVELMRASQWFSLWRKAYAVRQRQKRAMLDFPCAPSMQRPSEVLRSLCPDRPETSHVKPDKMSFLLNRRTELTLVSPLEAERRSLTLTAHLSLASLLKSLQRTRAWQPLNLASLLGAPVSARIKEWPDSLQKELGPLGIQWKLLLSLPGETDLGDDGDEDNGDVDIRGHGGLMKTLSTWLCAKFTHGETGQQKGQAEVLSLYSVQIGADDESQTGTRVSVCVRNVPEFAAVKPNLPSEAQCQKVTKGTSAILFLLPHADTEDDTLWLASRLRLAKLLEAKPLVPPVPLALLLPRSTIAPTSSSLTRDTTARLGVEQFQDKGLVSEVAVVELPIKPQVPVDAVIISQVLQRQLTEAVKWLSGRLPEPPQLKGMRLGELVEDFLTEHFFTPVLQDQRLRQDRGKLQQAPNTLIGLYNSALDHMALALTSPALEDISWPAPEFLHSATVLSGVPPHNWNNKSHLADIYQFVSSLRLPWFRYQDQEASEWSQVCQDVWTFIKSFTKPSGTASVSLTTRVSRLLAQACLDFENLCSLTQNEDYCTPTYINAPWTDIILACVNFRLESLHSWKDEAEDLVGGHLEVFFEEEDLEEFEPPAAWIQALLDTEDMENHLVAETVNQAVAVHMLGSTYTDSDNDSDDSMVDSTTHPDSENKNRNDNRAHSPTVELQSSEPVPEYVRTALCASQNLLLHMEEEKRKTREFELYLERALHGDTADECLMDLSAFSPNLPTSERSMSTQVYFNAGSRGGTSILATPCRYGSRAGSSPSFPPRLTSSHEGIPGLLSTSSVGQPSRTERDFDTETGETWYSGPVTVSVSVERLREDLQNQRQASDLFEKRLQALLES